FTEDGRWRRHLAISAGVEGHRRRDGEEKRKGEGKIRLFMVVFGVRPTFVDGCQSSDGEEGRGQRIWAEISLRMSGSGCGSFDGSRVA
ncbi:hypothetical protein HAX54_029193, partial [Datura stramonium]|nr:hypothetical protein [Datura stramonium]